MGKMLQQTCTVILLLVGFVVVAQAATGTSTEASTETTASVTPTSSATTPTTSDPPANPTSGGATTTTTPSTPVSGNPATSPPTGSSNPGSTTVARNQCYNHTCTERTCLKDDIASSSSSVATCSRGDKFCKITRTLKNKTYTIVAECVNDSCQLSNTSSDANGQVTFNCCQTHLCNTEEILNSAGGTLHAYLPVTLVAVVALTSLV